MGFFFPSFLDCMCFGIYCIISQLIFSIFVLRHLTQCIVLNKAQSLWMGKDFETDSFWAIIFCFNHSDTNCGFVPCPLRLRFLSALSKSELEAGKTEMQNPI